MGSGGAGGKSTGGYTKAAQSAKFVRNRDVKLKDREERREETVQRAMCEGICDKCREKVQWKFQYGKYKSLTKPGTCQNCKNKTVTKAYRAFCDLCAKKKNVCGACCGNVVELNNTRKEELAKRGIVKDEDDEDEDDEEREGEDMQEQEDEVDGEDGEDCAMDGMKINAKAEEQAQEEVQGQSVFFQVTDREERQMQATAASKYSKARQTGTEDDQRLKADLEYSLR